MVVEADGLPDRLDPDTMERLVSLPAVVVACTAEPDRRPQWADLVSTPDDPVVDDVVEVVGDRPLAATVLALLLRSGGDRTVAAGLVAESTAYGLLQAGPEFARWRASRPARRRDGPSGRRSWSTGGTTS